MPRMHYQMTSTCKTGLCELLYIFRWLKGSNEVQREEMLEKNQRENRQTLKKATEHEIVLTYPSSETFTNIQTIGAGDIWTEPGTGKFKT